MKDENIARAAQVLLMQTAFVCDQLDLEPEDCVEVLALTLVTWGRSLEQKREFADIMCEVLAQHQRLADAEVHMAAQASGVPS